MKQCDTINESCWNLEIENQKLKDTLKEEGVLLEKALESARKLQYDEGKLRLDHDHYRNLAESTQERIKELENSLNNLKKRQVLEPIKMVVKEIVKRKSISVQVDQKVETCLPSKQSKKEIANVDETFLSTISHLQTENAILGLKNDDLKRINQELENGMHSLLEFHEKSSQTDLYDFQISETAALMLMQVEKRDEWEIKRHVGFQVPSILQADCHHDLLIQKKQRFKLDTRNAETIIEEIQELPTQNILETSERISTIFAGPATGENMIDALVYTMIGSWVRLII
jgi:hypothetical protein